MQPDDGLGQPIHKRDVELMVLGETIEERVPMEARHFDQPVEQNTMAAQRERTIGLACHRKHAEGQRWRGPAIQANFGLTRDPRQLNRREVDVVENGPRV